MDKKEALKKLAQLEKETKELRSIIEAPEDLKSILTSWITVVKYKGENNINLPYANPITKLEKHINADYKINIISDLFNKGIELDWINRNQPKYIIWHERKASGWVVRDVVDFYFSADTGSGCYFANKQDAQYIANQFHDIFLDWLPN